MSGATEWIRHRGRALAQCFGLRRAAMPCQTPYSNVLALVDGQQLDELLRAFFVRWEAQSRCGDEPSRLQTPQGQADHRQLAIDGKTIRATTSQNIRCINSVAMRLLQGLYCGIAICERKRTRRVALKPLLNAECVTGRIVTLDAMHTQRELCAQVHRLGGDYILIAKDNQPTLREDIADLLEDRRPDRRRWQEAETWNKGHGRLEHRQIICSPDLNDWFGKRSQGIEQVFRLERTTCLLKSGKLRHEVVYGGQFLAKYGQDEAWLEQLVFGIR